MEPKHSLGVMQRLGRKSLIVLISVAAACVYGVLHDQVTARVCIEYFTVAHPPLFHTESVTMLAFCWGVAATLGIGILLGFVLAAASQGGTPAPEALAGVVRAVVFLLLIMALAAVVAGLAGYLLSRLQIVALPSAFASVIPLAQHDRFTAVWFAHCASYLAGLAGSAFLCFTSGGDAAIHV